MGELICSVCGTKLTMRNLAYGINPYPEELKMKRFLCKNCYHAMGYGSEKRINKAVKYRIKGRRRNREEWITFDKRKRPY